MWHGCLTALVTPFRGGERRRRSRSSALVEAQIAGGVHGLVPCGSTGESATLTHDEHISVVRDGRAAGARTACPVIAGTGSNSTAEAIRLTQRRRGGRRRRRAPDLALLQQAHAGRHLSTTTRPSPKRPSSRSSSTTSRAAPARTSCPRRSRACRASERRRREGGERLAGSRCIEIVATCGPGLRRLVRRRRHDAADHGGGRHRRHLGRRPTSRPQRMVDLTGRAARRRSRRGPPPMHDAAAPLPGAPMQLEVNPIPVKTALALMGLCTEEFRLPLTLHGAGPTASSSSGVLRELWPRSEPVGIVVCGAAGRMGRLMIALARRRRPTLRVVGAIEAPGHPAVGQRRGRARRRRRTRRHRRRRPRRPSAVPSRRDRLHRSPPPTLAHAAARGRARRRRSSSARPASTPEQRDASWRRSPPARAR